MRRTHAWILAVLAALVILAYLPVLHQPLLEDDYPNLEQARLYGPVSGWHAMLADPVFRYRATFYVMTHWLDAAFGPSATAFYAASILLHILCTWLVYALGMWRVIGWRISSVAAGFFAVAEGHQEAIMWFSASSELLMFLFGMAALVCWIRFMRRLGGARWYAASLAAFVLALLSKESAVVFAILIGLPMWATRNRKRPTALWLPFAALALIDIWLVYGGRTGSFRFHDGSFSLSAPFWITLPVSFVRLLWVWGLASAVFVILLRIKQHRRLFVIAGIWIVVALLPYSFLTYMHRIPSRQTYLASVAVAWIAAAGFWTVYARLRWHRQAMIAAVVAIVIGINIGYLWTKKRRQFLDRAAPTEALIAIARQTGGPIYMRCFPAPPIVYEAAVRVRTGKPESILIWDAPREKPAAAVFCWGKR